MAAIKIWLLIGLGGAGGALARWQAGRWLGQWRGTTWPWPTLLINLTGSLLLGGLAGWPGAQALWQGRLWPLAAVGFMGAFTTFSTFSVETLSLLQQGRTAAALGYALVSPLCGVLAALGGYSAAQLL